MLFKINHFGFLLFLTLLTGCSSCEDPGQITVVEGHVTNAITGSPAIDAAVVLWIRTETADNFNGGANRFSTRKMTDSTGFYSLTFFNDRTNTHSMQVVSTAKFDCSESREIEIGERNELNFSVLPQDTLLELQFTQTDFENNPDSVAVAVHFENSCATPRFEFQNYVRSTNLNVDNTLPIFTQPNVAVQLDFNYFENGVLVKSEDILVVAGSELEVVEVEY